MSSSSNIWVRNRRVAVWGGIAAIVAGALLLHDAYEHRGRSRPFGLKLLPGA